MSPQIQEAHFESRHCLEGVCETFGPQIAFILLNMSTQAIATLAISVDMYLAYSSNDAVGARTHLYVYLAVILSTVPDFLFSILRALSRADGVTTEVRKSFLLPKLSL